MIIQGLRVALPPLASLHRDSSVQVFEASRGGGGVLLMTLSLATLAAHLQRTKRAGARKAAVHCLLHPDDSLLASLTLPPLSAPRLEAAVRYAAQAFILGPVEQFHIAHGPREADGQVMLAWLERIRLQRLLALLHDCQLRLAGVYPAPYGLPLPADGTCEVAQRDYYLLERSGAHQARVEPRLPADTLLCAASLDGPLPTWSLHGRLAHGTATEGWGRALACCALAAVVWLVGVNLYARQLTHQGIALRQQMNAQVRQAFPGLDVVLNPLQQARQQIQAGSGTALQDPGRRFAALLEQSADAMPFLAGAVQTLAFSDGELHITLAEGYRTPTDGPWQAQLVKQGVEALPTNEGWTLRALALASGDGAPGDAADDPPPPRIDPSGATP
ncbi:type II secretion system protein GspL [Pseudomonas huanghezhanensis]|uniref:type II secretion system protein GspL n=1 Tax=Pseudomonas huanghezhanensis TaxID=3002903 RepID=UPI002285D654|nr:type II secretion system protein GspL [Pseudomonas sp. BSw22131]